MVSHGYRHVRRGNFTPLILAGIAFGAHHKSTLAAEFTAIEQAAFLDLFLILGFVINILLVDRWGRIKLQVLGFAGMALGLVILAVAVILPGGGAKHLTLLLAGFTIFNLLMNMGPNATTFLLPAELFPTAVRASGHGFAAGCAKFGAAVGIFFLPILQSSWGVSVTILCMALVSLIGLIVTLSLRVETKGRSLEELEV